MKKSEKPRSKATIKKGRELRRQSRNAKHGLKSLFEQREFHCKLCGGHFLGVEEKHKCQKG